MTGEFGNGETISLTVDFETFSQSVHAQNNVLCEDCHADKLEFPHHASSSITHCSTCHGDTGMFEKPDFSSIRLLLVYQDHDELQDEMLEICLQCHEEIYQEADDSIHTQIAKTGNPAAPNCIDCHGSHEITPPDEPREKPSQLCGECHGAVYSTYQYSVHGKALEADGNPDVPTCTSCHGAHHITGPRDLEFRNSSILICGECHSDPEVMDKYDISTEVLDTYLADFHGRTVNMFRLKTDTSPSDKATCYDCHGIHNILRPENPNSMVYPTNLQETCARCHEDANITFPEAWLSHYVPDLDENPIIYAVNIGYPLFVFGALGFMFVYMFLDARKRISEKLAKRKPKSSASQDDPPKV
jgi:hypothetical protein